MPFIKDEELLDFHKAIDFNKNMAEEWKERYDAKELENNRLNDKKKRIILALITTGLLCLFLIFIARVKPFWIANNDTLNKSGYNMGNSSKNPQNIAVVKKDTSTTETTSFKHYDGVTYQVQIAAFKNFRIAMHSDEFNDLSEQSNGFNKYALGKFSTYADATTFKNDLQKLGFKKSFLVSFYNNEQIEIRKALELSNEPEFLEQ